MATSRTGTTKYLRNRARVLRQAQTNGLTHCPGYEDGQGNHINCGRELNYQVPKLPESAEADHILEHRHGGTDDVDNLRVICRTCNLARNRTRVRVSVPADDGFPTSQAW
ncbi:HNH endonuclease signature motif containing protein [Georgenia thermotolerans]|uniref:HNH endonuclease signature motif containing protein n=1 Tax=Georgenia thermotolerans TaxID=527326 RepID=UPI00126484C2